MVTRNQTILITVLSLIITFLLGGCYPLTGSSGELKPKDIVQVDFYNIYYILEIQQDLGMTNKKFKEEVKQSLKDKSLIDITNGRFLSPLPSLWYFAQLTKDREATDIHKKEAATFVRDLQQDDGLFTLDKNTEQVGGESDITSKLLPTKLSIDILKQYGEEIPKRKALVNKVSNELRTRLTMGENIQLDGHTMLLLQILQELEPTSELFSESRKLISFQQIEVKIKENLTNPGAITELIQIAKIIDTNKKVDSNLRKELEKSFNGIQLKNGAFPFPMSNEADLLTTQQAIGIMHMFNIKVNKKQELLDYINDIAAESFIK